jgi:hypothetical protein
LRNLHRLRPNVGVFSGIVVLICAIVATHGLLQRMLTRYLFEIGTRCTFPIHLSTFEKPLRSTHQILCCDYGPFSIVKGDLHLRLASSRGLQRHVCMLTTFPDEKIQKFRFTGPFSPWLVMGGLRIFRVLCLEKTTVIDLLVCHFVISRLIRVTDA